MEPLGCPEMSVRKYPYSLRNNPFSSSSRREPEVTATLFIFAVSQWHQPVAVNEVTTWQK